MSQQEQFAKDVLEGLSASPKTLPSKWFYDEVGDKLFVEIMHMPEYYLTRAEFEIFSQHTNALISALNVSRDRYFEIVELGAGDGTKTKELIRGLRAEHYDFAYLPIDISGHALEALESALSQKWPDLKVQPKQGLYFEVLEDLKASDHPKVVLFLGSNLGNLSDERAAVFLKQLAKALKPGDRVLIGLDQIKPVELVLPAYNDAAGITAQFNLNLLTRINRELGGNFQVDQFTHQPEYLEEEGIARSYLQCEQDQEVHISALNQSFHIAQGERIHTEVSRKYNEDILSVILSDTGLEVVEKITDSQGLFADFILKKS